MLKAPQEKSTNRNITRKVSRSRLMSPLKLRVGTLSAHERHVAPGMDVKATINHGIFLQQYIPIGFMYGIFSYNSRTNPLNVPYMDPMGTSRSIGVYCWVLSTNTNQYSAQTSNLVRDPKN